jgi:hypothetical protein
MMEIVRAAVVLIILVYFAMITVMPHSAPLIVIVPQILVLMEVVLHVVIHQYLNAVDLFVNKIVIA